jgi:hypothetical protein
VLWATQRQGIFQVNISSTVFNMFQFQKEKGAFIFGGASVAFDGTYYVASVASIYAFNNEIPFDFTTPIIQTGEFFLPDLENNEHIIDITLIESQSDFAALIVVTSRGKMVALSLDFTKVTDVLQLPGIESVEFPDHFVSMAMITDGAQDGAYVATSVSITRVQWDCDAMSLRISWTADTSSREDWLWGRSSPGFSSAPRLVGPPDAPEYVVTTTGSSPSEVLFFDTRQGALVASHRVLFGHDNDSDIDPANVKSTVSQPVLVLGHRVVVTNNWVSQSPPALCSEWMAGSQDLPVHRQKLCPYLMGEFSHGLEQFEIDPISHELRSVWSNPDVSCSSASPVFSLPGDDSAPIMFCVGKRLVSGPTSHAASTFSVEAVSWTTGKSIFHIPLGESAAHNCLFAALGTSMLVNEGNALIMAALGGLYRILNINCDAPTPYPPQKLSNLPAQYFSAIDILDELVAMYQSGDVPFVDIAAVNSGDVGK